MADIALGSVGKIIEIALKIKEAAETVKHNEKECLDIQRCVANVSALIKKLDDTTETMRDEVMRNALEDLAESLEYALKLVKECQRKHIFRRFLGAGDMAKDLDRVQNDIAKKLALGNFATNVQANVMLTNIQSTSAPPPPSPPPPPRREAIDDFTRFTSSELKDATNDFSGENIIPRGEAAIIWKAWEAQENLRMEFFNPSLCDGSQLMLIKRCMKIGLLCIDFDKKRRPTMAEVLAMLNGDTELPAPN